MMKQIKIALFDVDKTIIDIDSMFELYKYAIKKYPIVIIGVFNLVYRMILYKIKRISTEQAKEAFFYFINMMTDEDLEEFYNNYLSNRIYLEAIEEMKQFKSMDYKILLVSASPEAYIKYFNRMEYVDDCIGTQLKKNGNRYINIIDGSNCKGEEKVYKIEKWINKNGFQIDKENSYAFSDSLSDLPMLKMVDNPFLINYKKEHEIPVVFWGNSGRWF